MNLRFQIQYLSGGDATFGPDFGGATINTVTRAGLSQQCPNLGRLLHNLKFTLRGGEQKSWRRCSIASEQSRTWRLRSG